MPANNPSEIHALFLHAFNGGDAEAITALYEPDAILVLGSERLAGHAAIRAAYERMLARRGRMELETRSVIESGHGLAVLHASWSLHTSGSTAQGISTEVVRRQPDNTWLFVIDEPRTPK
jgi:uncharacterized protein (TIGR02246 family)